MSGPRFRAIDVPQLISHLPIDAYVPAANAKSHARIIWDGCWAANDSFFATASRDKTASRSKASSLIRADVQPSSGQNLVSPFAHRDRRRMGLLGNRQI